MVSTLYPGTDILAISSKAAKTWHQAPAVISDIAIVALSWCSGLTDAGQIQPQTIIIQPHITMAHWPPDSFKFCWQLPAGEIRGRHRLPRVL